MAAQRARWLVGVGGAVVALAAAVYFYRQRPAEPPPAVEVPPLQPRVTERVFAPWMRFEPAGEHGEYFARFYIDAMLGHQVFKVFPRGVSQQIARGLLLDDDDLLLPSGRRLWNRESLVQPGLTGKYCYIHSDFCLKRLFEVYFVIDGKPAVIYDNQYAIERFPSRTSTRFHLGGVAIDEHKYITYDDRAVCTYQAQSADGKPHKVALNVVAQHPTMPNSTGPAAFPLLGKGQYQGRPVYVYLDAPGFAARSDAYPAHLQRTIEVPAGEPSARVNVAVSYENGARGGARPLPEDLLDRHAADYQRWFADNVPYFDAPDGMIKKMWYYRWWIVRLHLTEPETPDLAGFAFYEGKLGFDNLISFAVPAQLKELTYLRDPRFGLDQARNAYRNLSAEGALMDATGSPYWGEMYSQWVAGALADFHRVHPIDAATLRQLLPAMAGDVRAWMREFDPDKDFLPSRDIPRITGYDLDILSWWHFNGMKLDLRARPPALERADFASFVYANAAAIAELAAAAGEQAMVEEFAAVAAGIRAAVLRKLWDPASGFFYPQRAGDDARIPVRELHGFFPIAMRLAPDEAAYVEALRKFVDPEEFWSRFPPVITSMAHYRQWTWDMDGLTRNIAPHPISMGGLTLIRALHDYHQSIVTPAHFMELMARYTALMYPGVHPGDPSWRPNAHEYYSAWEPGARSPMPKPSDISHDFHSMYNALVVEGIVGLKPRNDDMIELRPAARDWSFFALDRLRHRSRELTIVWDKPDGQVRYQGFPEGLTLAIDGKTAFTRPNLDPVVYDPAAGKIVE